MRGVEQMVISCPSDNVMAWNAAQGARCNQMRGVEQMVISCPSDNVMAWNAAQGARCNQMRAGRTNPVVTHAPLINLT